MATSSILKIKSSWPELFNFENPYYISMSPYLVMGKNFERACPKRFQIRFNGRRKTTLINFNCWYIRYVP